MVPNQAQIHSGCGWKNYQQTLTEATPWCWQYVPPLPFFVYLKLADLQETTHL